MPLKQIAHNAGVELEMHEVQHHERELDDREEEQQPDHHSVGEVEVVQRHLDSRGEREPERDGESKKTISPQLTELRRLRKERGWTAARLAEEMGVSKLTVLNYERGKIQRPSLTVMLAAQQLLGLDSIEELLGSVPQPETPSKRLAPTALRFLHEQKKT